MKGVLHIHMLPRYYHGFGSCLYGVPSAGVVRSRVLNSSAECCPSSFAFLYFASRLSPLFYSRAYDDLVLHPWPATNVCVCVCVCVFSSHSFWTSSSLDIPAGVTQEEGHTGFLIHLLSAVRALVFLARRIQPSLSLVDREVEFCVLTVGHFFFFF